MTGFIEALKMDISIRNGLTVTLKETTEAQNMFRTVPVLTCQFAREVRISLTTL